MFITIITDCQDPNATGRQITRATALFQLPANLVGISSDIEAAGNIIDMLDASDGQPGIIMANIAPRHKDAKRWPNGTPFGYFWYKNTLIVSTVDGLTLSLVKKLKLTDAVQVFDIPTVADACKDLLTLYPEQSEYLKHTQFRSFEFMPRVAKWVWDKRNVPAEKTAIETFPDAGNKVWWIDSFGAAEYGGNCKTTIFPEEVGFAVGKTYTIQGIGEITGYAKLKDVPDKTPALIVGSSGYNEHRFLEIVVQGENAAKKFNLNLGDDIVIS